jgi:hypothetical protein
MHGGGTLGRTLAVGWKLALSLWPVAAIAAAPALAASLLGGVDFLEKPTWQTFVAFYGLAAVAEALIAAALLPSVMRWFADAREDASFHRRDMRGRWAPALAAACASALLPLLLSDSFYLLRLVRSGPPSALPVVAFFVAYLVGVWIRLRLLLMVAVAVVERGSVLDAVRRSWSLTRGWMRTIVGVGFVLAVCWLMPVIVSMKADLGGLSPSHHFAWSAAVSQTLMMPWFFAFVAVLYHDARIRHDDVDTRRIADDASSR